MAYEFLKTSAGPLCHRSEDVDTCHYVFSRNLSGYDRPGSNVGTWPNPDTPDHTRAVSDDRVVLDIWRLFVDLPPAAMRPGVLMNKLPHDSRSIADHRSIAYEPGNDD